MQSKHSKSVTLLAGSLAIGAAISVSAASAQRTTPPSDTVLMHRVEGVLQNEKAFVGLVIVPTISHRVVTLTGSVSSAGDRVLAGMEVGNVDGVKTVINNLEVASSGAQPHASALTNPNGAQTQQLTAEAHTAAPTAPLHPAEKTVTLAANTALQIRMDDALTSKTAKAGDVFHGTVSAAVNAGGVVAIPKGTGVLGRVVSAKPAGRFVGAAQMSLELTALSLPSPAGSSQDVPVVTRYETANTSGVGQIQVKEGAVMHFQTQEPLRVTPGGAKP